MRFLLTLLSLSILAGCGQSPTTSPNVQPAAATAAAATFQFSKAAAMTVLKDEKSWCNGDFNAALINADPANVNRRYFLMDESVHRVAVQSGNATSSFFLKKTDGKKVEIFTSDNFPFCSSNRANFSLAPEGAWFRYDNARGIAYTVEAQSSVEGLFVILEFPVETTYGLTVHHCVGCR